MMRYLIDPEYRAPRTRKRLGATVPYAAELRRDLSERNLRWTIDHGYSHEVSLGSVPAVLYREDKQGNHGNFLPSVYRRIQTTPAWARRLNKVHTTAGRSLLSHDPDRRELDSSNSSDALLMNVFCHPGTLRSAGVRSLLGINGEAAPLFGYRPGVPLLSGRPDCTEIDMRLGELLIEAKLTESDFQNAPRKLVERYQDLQTVFTIDMLEWVDDFVRSYQLIRNVLAAYAAPECRFCVLCDARRPDLIAAWNRILRAVKIYDLRNRLQVLTWQEMAGVLPSELQLFLEEKYGIRNQLRW